MMTVYIAGPISLMPEGNLDAFTTAELLLIKRGEVVENPRHNVLPLVISKDQWTEYMYLGLEQLLRCDSIYLLKGWEKSKGACIEFNLACNLQMKIEFQE